jgi:N-acetylglucosaminyldiphosphoundecaprenol N-acetyl-beta-D-mannosaminyltransferase
MTLGVPVIATRVGGNAEVIEHEKTGLLIQPSQPIDLVAAIERLYHDAAQRRKFAARAQEMIKDRFSQSKMVGAHEKRYRDLIAARAVSRETPEMNEPQDRPFSRANVLGCPVDKMTLDDCIAHFEHVIQKKSHCHIVVVNAAKVVKARRDHELHEVIQNADLVGADGVPIVWASRLLGDALPGRVNGTDLMDRLFFESAKKGWRLYLLGARQAVIEKAVHKLQRQIPQIQIVGFRNGYFDSLEQEQQVVQEINTAEPDVLLLGFGTPMKEKWVKRHRAALNVPIIHGVGGSFDIVGELTRRAPKWMQKSGLEWLYRLIQEPRRMWKRYLVTNSMFVWLVVKARVHIFFSRKNEHCVIMKK